jgi:hypothetical protein
MLLCSYVSYAQIELNIVEDYIINKGDKLSKHLNELGYKIIEKNLWSEDSVYSFKTDENEIIDLVYNKGVLINIFKNDSIDMYLDYLFQIRKYLEEDNKEVKSVESLENNVIKISLNSFITYILDPKNSKIMIFNTTN